MANIKFSQFTVGNTESDIDFVVGYKGANNIQISPANLLSATLAGYLPLTGGTMTGNVKFNDNIELRLGNGADLKAYHSGTHTYFDNNVGDLIFRNLANDKDIVFQSDDGSGGVTTYFSIDGGAQLNRFAKNAMWNDNVAAYFGGGFDLKIIHNGSFSSIQNNTGDLKIINYADDTDIIFESDNGSGGTTEYFRIDGGSTLNVFSKSTWHGDGVSAFFGNSTDLQIYHDGSHSYVKQGGEGDLYIQQFRDDGDILFQSDDGSGGMATYLYLDGSITETRFSKATRHSDNIISKFGDGNDLNILHDSNHSYIKNYTGDLYIENFDDDKDIIFKSDDGSGGVTEYFRLDGSAGGVLPFTVFPDNSNLTFGTGYDLRQYHNGTNSYLDNYEGNLIIRNYADDKDIQFYSDNGSGGIAEYFKLDGGSGLNIFYKDIFAGDNVRSLYGNNSDLRIYHNGSNDRSYIYNTTGDLYIENDATDGDIKFYSDDGSGGTAQYFRLDGGVVETQFLKSTLHFDNVKAKFGDSNDFQIYHEGTDSIIQNYTGSIYIDNNANNSDIVFRSDDGSGGITNYIQIDGSEGRTLFNKHIRVNDSVQIQVGSSADLKIFHDGSNSFIDDTGTGILYIRAAANMYFQTYGSGKRWASFFENQGIELFYNDIKKLETRSTGIKISGVSEYADNTAAIAGGLITGDVYRTGDLLKIVH